MPFDLNGVEPKKVQSYSALPAGDYEGTITKIEEGVSAKGSSFINFEVTLSGEYAKRKVWRRFFLKGSDDTKTKTCLGIFAGCLEDLGMTQEERHATKTTAELSARLVGLPVKLTLSVREYNGKVSNEIVVMSDSSTPF